MMQSKSTCLYSLSWFAVFMSLGDLVSDVWADGEPCRRTLYRLYMWGGMLGLFFVGRMIACVFCCGVDTLETDSKLASIVVYSPRGHPQRLV